MHAETLEDFSSRHQAMKLKLRQSQAASGGSRSSSRTRGGKAAVSTPRSRTGRSSSRSSRPASRTASRASSRASSVRKAGKSVSGASASALASPVRSSSSKRGIRSPSATRAQVRSAQSAERVAMLEMKVDQQASEIRRLKEQLELQTYLQRYVTQELAATTELTEYGRAAESPYYTVTFGPEPIGMIVVLNSQRECVVGELRDGPDGSPLSAKASGKVRIGDSVIAVNERNLATHTTLADVSRDFREAGRPVRVLFRRQSPSSSPPRAGGPPVPSGGST